MSQFIAANISSSICNVYPSVSSHKFALPFKHQRQQFSRRECEVGGRSLLDNRLATLAFLEHGKDTPRASPAFKPSEGVNNAGSSRHSINFALLPLLLGPPLALLAVSAPPAHASATHCPKSAHCDVRIAELARTDLASVTTDAASSIRDSPVKSRYAAGMECYASELVRTRQTAGSPSAHDAVVSPQRVADVCAADALATRPSSSTNEKRWRVLGSSLKAALKLCILCGAVAYLQASGAIPKAMPEVLSKVSFQLFIPCFLISNVTGTLATQDIRSLILLPLMALTQILCGALFGHLATKAFLRDKPDSPTEHQVAPGVNSPTGAGGPIRSGYLRTHTRAEEERLVVTCMCAFGNAITLPLIFLLCVLDPMRMKECVGCMALFLIGWSPSFWTVAYKLLTFGEQCTGALEASPSPTPSAAVPETPSDAATPLLEQARGVLAGAAAVAKRTINPPLMGVFIGAAIGATPLKYIFLENTLAGSSLPGAVMRLTSSPWLQIALSSALAVILVVGTTIMEAIQLMGTATLPVQTCVLAGSLLPPPAPKDSGGGAPANNSAAVTATASHTPQLQGRVFWIVAVVRYILNPLAALAFLTFVRSTFPGFGLPASPLCDLTLMALSFMPPAQNLIVLLQLRDGTRPWATPVAKGLLQQYLFSVVPLTVWLTFIVKRYGIA